MVKVIRMDWNGCSTLKKQQGGTSLMVKFSKVFDKDTYRRSLNHIRILLSKEILLGKKYCEFSNPNCFMLTTKC